MKFNVAKLHEQVIFLNEQAGRLDLLADKPGNQWERGERAHLCIHCGKPAPLDWYED
jgi:hypothetical protein